MMSYEQMVEVLDSLGADVSYWEEVDEGERCLDVTVQDFDGFDEDWSEVMREYDDPEAVERFLDMLESECVSQEGDFYVWYHFDGFTVQLGFGSFDI